MKLSAPKVWVWWLSVILGVVGIVGQLLSVKGLEGNLAFGLIAVGLALLAVANLIKGL